ncbi:Transmembrane inner ear [Caenorhabditis elegans]|uniref:Transmembrane inner ear n=1 Tax=Caenorhabditis elegans TaxID=6239 RepID=Q9XXE7_CAEEL|nr:Transmembrane inner ear [Caenorhabditis elegans]7USW_D Chain D, Transmembrane inner ear expressed protein [Caenorhabditis elegans]7USW_F Chain F, Transmembrane inner ear expressed protein [Caenorhabditis elegans]7USX_D Chain D, Transmembrane inner ear expressed protein [Caenorhabditis elegans]7USX_F Chain F, Transmembrane inner ear expressed protein [Caenorhabditis elegans]7USY_D Chain D, Transmembrane inner ear expressed protein [Caenorhabditis elegans]7USY_F Chain F, Transmembrane inner |eukprot:NP_499391.1 Uncharacterized protein CELE_Y39A1C.1 [Caenorhabditis elegans]
MPSGNEEINHLSALDQFVAPGLRLWMLIALVGGVLLIMIVIVCCFMRIRIPRTKRQIDLIAAKRKLRKSTKNSAEANAHNDERAQAIVMNSMPSGGGGGAPSTSSSRHTGSRIQSQV